MRMLLPFFLVAACVVSPISAFAPPCPSASRLAHKPLSAIAPEHVDALSTAVDSWQHVMATSSNILADAADATAEVAKSDDSGWWAAYLNLFEQSIRLVHSAITPTLNSIGVTETWGISIAIFTACMSLCVIVVLAG